jgi:hypothetical protein
MGDIADSYIDRMLDMRAPVGYFKNKNTIKKEKQHMPNTNTAHIVLRNVRLSYTHLDKPYAQQPGQEPKYSATILVPKNPASNKALIDAAIATATQKTIEKYGKAFPMTPKVSVHDGDGTRPSDGQPFGDECKGCWVFTASSKQPVTVVDTNLQQILDPTQIYSGMYANVGVTFFGYSAPQNKGIGVALDNVQKTADGEPLGGTRASAEDDFGAAPAYSQYAQQPEPQTYAPTPSPAYQQPAYQQPVYTQQQYAQPVNYPVDPITGAPLTR